MIKIILRILLYAGITVLAGCRFDETPADLHAKLVPQIAQQLIDSQHSDRLNGLPPQAEKLLKKYASTGMTYEVGVPNTLSETGIRFYTKDEHKLFLTISLDLNASENGYIVRGVN